jgi:hypothetical protein
MRRPSAREVASRSVPKGGGQTGSCGAGAYLFLLHLQHHHRRYHLLLCGISLITHLDM